MTRAEEIIARQNRKVRIMKLKKASSLLLIVAAGMLILGGIGIANANQLTVELHRSGMRFMNIDEAIRTMTTLAKYSGESISDYFDGASGFILFTVMKRTLLMAAGSVSLAAGIITAWMKKREMAAQ